MLMRVKVRPCNTADASVPGEHLARHVGRYVVAGELDRHVFTGVRGWFLRGWFLARHVGESDQTRESR